MKLPLLLTLLWLVHIPFAQSLTYIDKQNPLISYVPQSSWAIEQVNGDYQSDRMVTKDPSAFASISKICTFTSFHFVSPKWPYKITTDISVDGGTPTTIDLQDYASQDDGSGRSTVDSGIVWSYTGSGVSVNISMAPGGPGCAIVDAFIFECSNSTTCPPPQPTTATITTTLHPPPATVTTTTTKITASPTSPPDNFVDHRKKKRTTIILAVIFSLLALLICCFILWRYRKYRRDRKGLIIIATPPRDNCSPVNPPAEDCVEPTPRP